MHPKIKALGARARLLPSVVILGISICLWAAQPAFLTAQEEKPSSDRKRTTKPELESKSPQQPPAKQKGFTIGVNVDLVVMHTTVFDKNGHFSGGLKKENFKLFEDGVTQAIASFSQEDVPVTLGIILDTSGSMRSKIDLVNKAALAFIKASNPDDQVFLIGFNDQIELITDFTSDIDAIADDLENVTVTGGTALYDAIYLAVQKAQGGSRPKKAIVIITDGEDRDSYYKLDELVSKVQESDVQIYSVGLMNPTPEKGLFGRWSKSVPEKAHDALQRISEETGAKSFFPKQVSEIHGIVSEIAHELRNQYSIGFVSSNTARDGTYRRIRITLDPSAVASNNSVRCRRGYFAPKAGTD